MSDWRILWKARTGERLDAQEASIWEETMRREVGGLTSDEMVDAIHTIGEQKRHGEIKFKPTVNHLISAIIANRHKARHGLDETELHTHKEQRIANARRQIQRHITAGRNVEAWTIICHHVPHTECDELMEWATENLNFSKPTLSEMGCVPYEQLIAREKTGGEGDAGVQAFQPHSDYKARNHNRAQSRKMMAAL